MTENFTLEDAMLDAFNMDDDKQGEPDNLTPLNDDVPPDNEPVKPESEQDAGEIDRGSKLEELEKEFGAPDEDDPFQELQTYEALLAQEEQELIAESNTLNRDFLSGFPVIENDQGISIYKMRPEQFNKFLQELGDDGKEDLKYEAQRARERAIQAAVEHQTKIDEFNNRLNEFKLNKSAVPQRKLELEVVTDLAKRLELPELVKKYQDGTVAKIIQEKAKTDPKIAQKAQSKEGLYQLGIMAVREMGLAPAKDKEHSETPSAPDAKTVSKKVRTKIEPESDEAMLAKVSKMSAREYAKLPAETRERLMYASLRNAL